MDPTPYIIGALAGLILGGGLAYVLINRILQGKADQIIKEAEQKGENINPMTSARMPALNSRSAPMRWFSLKAVPNRTPTRPRIIRVSVGLDGRMEGVNFSRTAGCQFGPLGRLIII